MEHTELMKALAWMGFGYMIGLFLALLWQLKSIITKGVER